MKNLLSKYAFWVLQIGGCIAFVTMIYLVMNVDAGVFKKLMFLTAMFLAYFIPTTILRYLYKFFVKTDPFKIIDGVKILIFLVVIVLLGKQLPYYLGYVLGSIFDLFDINPGKLEIGFKPPKTSGILSYVGPFIIYTGWSVFYFVIKQFRKSSESSIARAALKDKIRQAQLNTLKGHLNPSFMIASLHMIKELMSSDVPLARKLITKLSEILRYSLTKNNINSVSLNEEFDIVENYVALLNFNADGKYHIDFDLEPHSLKEEVPPMILTSLMELATKYGILMLDEGGSAILSSKRGASGLEIKLVHSGKIVRSSETELIEKTIRQRLRLLFNGAAEFNTYHELNNTTLLVNMPINDYDS